MIRIALIIFLSSLMACSSGVTSRTPASAGASDPCHEAMRTLFYRSSDQASDSAQFVDEVIDQSRLLDSGKLSQNDIEAIEASSQWRQFFFESSESATSEEQVMVAALLRKADPDAPIEAVQRKYRLLFEFCGL